MCEVICLKLGKGGWFIQGVCQNPDPYKGILLSPGRTQNKINACQCQFMYCNVKYIGYTVEIITQI